MKLGLRLLVQLILLTLFVTSHGIKKEGTTPSDINLMEKTSESGGVVNVLVGYGLVIFGALLSTLGALTLYLDPILIKLKLVDPSFKISEYEPFLAFTLAYSGGVLLATIFLDLLEEGFKNFESSNLFSNYNVKMLASFYFIFWLLVILTIKSVIRGRGDHSHGHSHNHGHNMVIDKGIDYDKVEEFELGSTKTDFYQQVDGLDSQTTLNIEEENDKVNQSSPTVQLIPNAKPTESLTPNNINSNVGYEVAIALAIHNFPEGVVTFLAAYQSIKGGILFGIALALHKFPEGLMIGIPIFLSTKSKLQAVSITFCASFFTQIFGATCAYFVSQYFWNDIIAALLFLLAAALLTITLFDGILPLANEKDKENKFMVPGIILGISSFMVLNSILDG